MGDPVDIFLEFEEPIEARQQFLVFLQERFPAYGFQWLAEQAFPGEAHPEEQKKDGLISRSNRNSRVIPIPPMGVNLVVTPNGPKHSHVPGGSAFDLATELFFLRKELGRANQLLDAQ